MHLNDPGTLWQRKAHWLDISKHSLTSSQTLNLNKKQNKNKLNFHAHLYVCFARITCVGPGANPSAHMHSKPPCRFVHVPLPHIFTLILHSFSSTHFFPVESNTYPTGHSHRYDPSVLMHSPPSQGLVIKSHSFKSSPLSPRPTPSGHSFENASEIHKIF